MGILWLFGIGSIFALIFGFVARKQIRARNQKGRGLAIAGIVLGWIGVGLLILAIIGAVTSTSTQTLRLTVTAYSEPCANSLFNNGATATVAGDNGSQLAAAGLSRGTNGSASLSSGASVPTCTYNASMVVPDNQNSYTFRVGGNSPITFSRSEMEGSGWNPGITFGCPANLQGGC
jgi:hypothetical protein